MEEQSFHPARLPAVVSRRKWWLIVPVVVCVDRPACCSRCSCRRSTCRRRRSAWRRRRCRRSCCAASARSTRKSGSARSAAAAQPDGPRARGARGEDRPDKPVDETAAWLRANVSQNISVPLPIGSKTDRSEAGLDSFILGYTDSDRTSAAHRQPPGVRVRRGELEAADSNASENTSEVLSQQVQASQARLTGSRTSCARRSRPTWAGCPTRSNANVQMVNGLRSQLESISMQLRGEQDRSDDGRGAARADAAGHGVARPSPPRRVAAVQSAQKRISDLQQQLVAGARAGYTDKHPDVDRAAGGDEARDRRRSPKRAAPMAERRRSRPIRSTGRSCRSATPRACRIRDLQRVVAAGADARSATTRAASTPRRWSSRSWRR